MANPHSLPSEVQAVLDELLEAHGAHAARVSGPELEAYATCVARLRDAQKRIAEEELIVPDAKNQPVPHPAFLIERQCMEELRKWGDKFKPRPAR